VGTSSLTVRLTGPPFTAANMLARIWGLGKHFLLFYGTELKIVGSRSAQTEIGQSKKKKKKKYDGKFA
jgi:hypothetical protein